MYHLLGSFVYSECSHELLVLSSICSGIGLQDYQHGGGLGMWSASLVRKRQTYKNDQIQRFSIELVNTSDLSLKLKVSTFYRLT